VAGERILIVDPNAGLLEGVEKMLASHGFSPLLAYSQNEGVKLAVTKSPELLLLHLPVDSAMQLLQRVVQTGRLIPAIFVVDQPSALVPIEVLRFGVQDYVTSQYITDDILHLVRRIVGRVTSSLNVVQLTEV
jgi:DNA-binding response OmpR family regulator